MKCILLLTFVALCSGAGIIGDFGLIQGSVTFSLFKKSNPGQLIVITKENAAAAIDKNAIVVFIVHGYQDARTAQWYEDLKNAYFAQDELYEVVEVDWHILAANPIYAAAAATCVPVGNTIGELVSTLIKSGYAVGNFRLAGHSLGAHIVGFAAKYVYQQTCQKLSYIEGFDPAGPAFTGLGCSLRMCATDAEQVVAIHTNFGDLGDIDAVGTVDIYANGGSIQPGCPDSLSNIADCSHKRSYVYATDALLHKGAFLARKCPNVLSAIVLGNGLICKKGDQIDIAHVSATATGIYYLKTNFREPFGRGSTF